jgi:hypothetical protein
MEKNFSIMSKEKEVSAFPYVQTANYEHERRGRY